MQDLNRTLPFIQDGQHRETAEMKYMNYNYISELNVQYSIYSPQTFDHISTLGNEASTLGQNISHLQILFRSLFKTQTTTKAKTQPNTHFSSTSDDELKAPD